MSATPWGTLTGWLRLEVDERVARYGARLDLLEEPRRPTDGPPSPGRLRAAAATPPVPTPPVPTTACDLAA